MKLNAAAFGAAAGITAAILFTLCAAFVAISPQAATAVFSYVLHLDLTNLARPLSFGSFVGGVLFWGLGTALVFGVAVRFYNALAGRRTGEAS